VDPPSVVVPPEYYYPRPSCNWLHCRRSPPPLVESANRRQTPGGISLSKEGANEILVVDGIKPLQSFTSLGENACMHACIHACVLDTTTTSFGLMCVFKSPLRHFLQPLRCSCCRCLRTQKGVTSWPRRLLVVPPVYTKSIIAVMECPWLHTYGTIQSNSR
jgi:hypothetical protein